MANWVSNVIKCKNNDVLPQYLNSKREFDFNILIPMPQDVENNCAWAAENWGTKWNALYTGLQDNNSTVIFETAWSDPVPVFKELCRRHPTEEIIFWSDSMEDGWYAKYENRGGELNEIYYRERW